MYQDLPTSRFYTFQTYMNHLIIGVQEGWPRFTAKLSISQGRFCGVVHSSMRTKTGEWSSLFEKGFQSQGSKRKEFLT